MSFFYDLNKKLDSIRAMPEVTHQQLNERDEGKPGKMFNKIAKDAGERYGSEAAGKRVAGAVRNKLRDQGKLEEDSPYKGDVPISDPVNKNYKPPAAGSQIKVAPAPQIKVAPAPQPTVTNKLPSTGAGAGRGGQGGAGVPEPSMLDKIGTAVGNAGKAVGNAVGNAIAPHEYESQKYQQQNREQEQRDKIEQKYGPGSMDESALQAAFGEKKYTHPGMIELQRLGRIGASEKTKAAARKRFNQYDDKEVDESMGQADEGNAFSGAVVKAKRDGIQSGEKINVGGKEYPVKEAAKYRDPKYKNQLYTQEPLDHTFGPDMDAAYYNNYPDDYAGRKSPMASGNGDPLTRGHRRSASNSINTAGKRKGMPSRDQITSLKGSIKDAHGTHARPNLPEAGNTPAGLAAVKKVGQRADRALGDAGTGRSGSELANPGKAYAARDRANAIQNRERDKQTAQNPTRVVGGPNHGNQMEEGGGVPMTAKQKSFAALAPPANKITFADKIAGAKKEVDEMLGNVAADAMKKAIGSGRGRNAEMDEGHFDDTPTRRRSSSGGEIDTSKPGSTFHRAVKGNYSGAAHSGEERRANQQADAADERAARAGRRPVGAGQGTKIGAKINRGTSKLMTREGDQDPADQGEYGREGESSRNNIHTMMRNAKQLEKMLGNEDNLPEWVQEKLTLASDYMQTIADYLASERETDAEDETGMELAEKKVKPTKKSSGDVVAGRLGKDEMGGKKKPSKAPAKKEEEVDESTTAGSVATAPTSGKAGKGSMSFGKGIYDSIDRAVERQITESMNISMSMNTDGGGAGQTLTITATDEDATQLAQMLKMAGLGGGDMSHGGEEVCAGCGMADCGCGDMEQMDETYGDNVVDMNSPNYPTNAESAQNNFGYAGGLNKPKRDVAGNGQSTVPVTAVRGQDDDFQESIQRMREIAGIKETPSIFFPDPKDTAKQLGISTTRLIDTPTSMSTGSNRSYNNTFLDPAQKAQQKQNESIFTDTANLWKSYKG